MNQKEIWRESKKTDGQNRVGKPPVAAICFFIATLLTAALIFLFSAQKGVDSQAFSDDITLRVAVIVRPDYTELPPQARLSYLEMMSILVRKNAHFCEFALLGFNLMCFLILRFFPPISSEGLQPPQQKCLVERLQKKYRQKRVNWGFYAWVISTLYAITDEIHQLFISERSAQVSDILIDSVGALVGVLLASVYMVVVKKVKRNIYELSR